MRGLALEGGGARGAYHIGVVKAYLENGYRFDGFVGTSIGAINAALLAQGDFDSALNLWTHITMDQIFDVDEGQILQIKNLNEKRTEKKLPSMRRALFKILEGGGLNTSKIKALLETYIDEEKIRESRNDFGLVTISVNELKPYELMLEDIPEGGLVNYIMASAALPGFRAETIDDKRFLDGGFYNNCPINLLAKKGYDEIVAVRTQATGVFRRIDDAVNVKIISPSENLGSIFLFTSEGSRVNIRLGYFDGLRSIKGLLGGTYYLNPVPRIDAYPYLLSLSDEAILEVGRVLSAPAMPAKRMLFEQIIPQLSAHLKLKKDFDYADFVIGLLEHSAMQKNIERYKVYDYGEFCGLIENTAPPEREKAIVELLPGGNLFHRKKTASELLTGHLLKNIRKSM